MIKLSVIIVNYNVKFFLEQALLSVRKASRNLSVEIFVVDNHSVDGSVQMVKEKFAEVILIENKDNIHLIRGNHEDWSININYGFMNELIQKYRYIDDELKNAIVQLYCFLPVAFASINE